MPLTNAQMNSIVSAGGSVGYRGTLITQAAQVPSDAQIASDAAVDFAGTHNAPADMFDDYIGPPPSSATVFARAVVRSCVVLQVGSVLTARVAATGTAVFTAYRNATQIGTFTFAAAATSATLVANTALTFFSPGDSLTIVAPATADATITDLSIGFAAQA